MLIGFSLRGRALLSNNLMRLCCREGTWTRNLRGAVLNNPIRTNSSELTLLVITCTKNMCNMYYSLLTVL